MKPPWEGGSLAVSTVQAYTRSDLVSDTSNQANFSSDTAESPSWVMIMQVKQAWSVLGCVTCGNSLATVHVLYVMKYQ